MTYLRGQDHLHLFWLFLSTQTDQGESALSIDHGELEKKFSLTLGDWKEYWTVGCLHL